MITHEPLWYPQEMWHTVTRPEDVGWSSEQLARAQAYSEEIGSAAVVIVHQGRILAEWGDTARCFNCHSARKSLLSALYGIHIEEGHIHLSSTMEELGIDDTDPPLTSTEKQATVQDLLQARSGIYYPASYEIDWAKQKRPPRGSHLPGTFWYYNNWDFNALGTTLEHRIRVSLFEDFFHRIALPLQLQDFRLEEMHYEWKPVSLHPAYMFRVSARDLARFGLLFLRNGKWRDQQLLSGAWVEACTTAYSQNEEGVGYGYLWWIASDGKLFPNIHLKDYAYAAKGNGGHYLVIIQHLDLLVMHRCNTDSVDHGRISQEQFGPLLSLILKAQSEG